MPTILSSNHPSKKKSLRNIFLTLLFTFIAVFSIHSVRAVQTTLTFMSDGGGTRADMVSDMDQALLQKLGGWTINTFNWAGDIAYDGTDGLESSVAFGVSAYASSTAGAANIPLFLAEGNHEAENASDVVTMRKMYATYQTYSVPGINGGAGWNFSQMPNTFSSTTNYAYDVGDVRMIVLNQYAATSSDAVNTTGRVHEQVFEWLKNEIKKTDKQHIAVMAHEPAYPVPSQTSGNHIGDALDADPANRDRFVNLLASYGHINHFVGHTHISDLYEMRDNSPAEGDARTTTTTLDGGIWELDSGGFGDKAPGGGSNGTYPGIGYLHTNSAAYGDYEIRLVQGTGSPQWVSPTVRTVHMNDLTRQILVNTWEGAGTGTSSNGLFGMKYYVDYTSAVGSNPDWSANNSGKWWENAFNATTAGWTNGELGVGYRTDAARPGWINTPIDAFGGLGTTTPQVHSIMQRVTFPATTTASYSNLTLHLDDDDGVMVWLNGTLILNSTNASVTAPTTGSSTEYFDKSQTVTTNGWAGAANTPTFTTYDVTAYKSALVNGQNVLTIWNINAGATSTDLGVAVRLSMSGAVDTTPPIISAVSTTTPTPNTATVSWTTNEAASTQVEYGLTTSYGSSTTLDPTLVTTHSVNITGLATSTLYHFRMASKDASNNISSSSDYIFTTPSSIPSGPATTTLRQGINGYSGYTDTYLSGLATSSNFATATTMLVDGEGPYANGLMKWDVSSIPSTATVTDVKIVYNVTNNSAANTYTIYRSIVPWVATEANWASSTASTAWGAPGGTDNADDYSPTSLGTLGTASLGLATSTLNASGRSLVQNWISGASPNYGFFINKTTVLDIDGLQFDSAEGAVAATRPALVVVYTLPSGPDATPPVISNIASSTTSTTATITWTTDELATSTISYGTSTAYGSTTASTTLVTSHSTQLTGLTASTTYHFRLNVADATGNLATSSDLTFFTSAPDVTPPVISSVASSTTSSGATITWSTNEAATSKVVYGTVSGTYPSVSTSSVSTTTPSHTLSGLASSTIYYFRVVSTDTSNNIATSSEFAFLTATTSGIAWEVYIDTGDVALSANKSTFANVMNFGGADGTSTSTRKLSDGSLTGITFNIAVANTESAGPETGSALEDNTSGTRATPLYASSTTDAAREFGTKVNVAGTTNLTTAGATMVFSFTGLDTNKRYTLVAYGSRGNYNNRWSRFTLLGATSFTNQSSAGALATTTNMSNDSEVINTGGNYNNGYVAKWIDIDPATTTLVLNQTSIAYSGGAANTTYMNAIKLVEQGTAGADTTPPVISSVASTTSTTTATITWTTDELATSTISYGTSTAYGSTTASTTLVTSHSTQLTGLTASTTYHFRLNVADATGNLATSSDLTFFTVPVDVTAPVISAVASTTNDSSGTVTWTTDENASSKVVYGTVSGTYTASSTDATLLTSHSRTISGLATSTRYYFRVVSADSSGNIATSSESSFTTTAGEVTSTAWWNASWGKRIKINLNNTQPADLIDFPIRVALNSSRITYGDFKSDGSDVRFVDADATTVLSHEVDTWDIATTSNFWVRVPKVNASSTTDYIYMYYNNPGASSNATTTGVWNSNYKGVWHMKENPATPGSNILDSTANAKNGSTSGAMTSGQSVAGQIGNALNFTGDDFVTFGSLGAITNRTVSLWINGNSWVHTNTADNALYAFNTAQPTGGNTDIVRISTAGVVGHYNGTTLVTNGSSVALNIAEWHYVTSVSSSTANASYIYQDGVQVATTSTWAPAVGATDVFYVGQEIDATVPSDWFNGKEDEVRVETVSQPLTWINAQYKTQTDAFQLYGSAESGADTTAPVISSIASSTGTSTASVTWSTNENASSSISYGLTTSYGTTATSSGTSTHSVSLTGLATSTIYHYRVYAVDASGNISTSSDQTFLTTTPADTTPPVISSIASSTGTSTASVTWSTNEAATSTIDYGLTTSYGTTATSSGTSTHSASLTGLATSTVYHYRVYAVDASGNVSTSSDLTFTTTVGPDVTAPIISSIASSTATSTASVTWSTNEAATSTVDYGLTTGYGTTATSSGTTTHSVSLTGLATSTTYHYRVTARDSSGNVSTSSDLTFVTAAGPDVTAPIVSSIASTTSTSTASVTWSTNENASSSISYGLTTGYGTTATSSGTSSHSVSLSGLATSTVYHYRVYAVDASGNVSTSSDATFTTTVGPDVTAPIISSIASSTGTSTANVTWSTNENASSSISYGLTTSYGTTATSSGTSSHSVSLTGLATSTIYHYRVYAVDASGNISTSSDQTFLTGTPADTTAPTISSVASSTGTSTATITWTTNENSTSVVDYGPTTSYGTASSSATLTTSHTINLTGLTPGATYHFQVTSVDAATNSTSSSDFTLTTSLVPDTTAPTVSMTAPTGGAVVSGAAVSLTANASDNIAVVGVQFKVDTNTLIGVEDTTPAYGVTWDSTGIADGVHALIAVARDSAGNFATSSSVSVTVDNTAPVRSAGSPSGGLGAGTTTVMISLITNEVASCAYSTIASTSFGSMTAFTNTSSTTHTSVVSGLSDGNTYTYYVKCQDGQSNVNATDYSISFSVSADTTPPVISSIASSTTDKTASTTFTTNENALVLVRYGLTTSYGSSTTLTSSGATSHAVNITGLLPLTLYHFQIQAQDALANISTSTDKTFMTTADVTGPVFSSIVANPGASTSTVTWTTDELASSKIQFGLSTSYGSSSAETDISPRVTSHSLLITNLSACAIYHYRVISKDASGNQATSTDQEFTTANCTGNSGAGVNEEQQVATSTGGSLDLLNGNAAAGIGLDIPAGFSTSSAAAFFQAIQLDTDTVIAAAGNPATGIEPVDNYMFRLNALSANDTLITSFNATITVTVTYNDSDIAAFNESSLWVYRYDGGTWYPLDDCVVDTVANTVTCSTTHFSDFTLTGILRPVTVTTGGGSSGGGSTGGSSGGGVLYITRPVTPNSTTTPAISPTNTALAFTRNLSLGMTHAEVLVLQAVLNIDRDTRIAISGPGSPGKETNLFGGLTKVALIKFQKKYKLPATGVVDVATRTKLNQLYKPATPIKSATNPMPVTNFKQFVRSLKLGDSNSEVLTLQQVLNSDADTMITAVGVGSPGHETNTFGGLTKVALIKFQIKYKIIKSAQDPYAGTVGPGTRARLNLMLK